ncbi:MAG: hypothetical protein ACXV8K_08075 [Ilumatobacteraceae bacterium]
MAPTTTSPSTATTETTTTVAPAPQGPATASLKFVGDVGLAGASSNPVVSCNFPTVDGTEVIRLLAQPALPAALFNITVSTDKISIVVASGSGTAYSARWFEGSGVTTFDPATGVQIDTQLTETTPSTTNHGTIGAITSVSGSIDCGNQTAGTSTVTYSGDSLEGPINAPPGPFRVECDTSSQGDFVSFVSIVSVGGLKALVFTTFQPDSINAFETFAGPPVVQHQYFVKAAGVSTLTGTGAHVVGDIVEQSPKTGEAHTLHIEGDVTCGATVHR